MPITSASLFTYTPYKHRRLFTFFLRFSRSPPSNTAIAFYFAQLAVPVLSLYQPDRIPSHHQLYRIPSPCQAERTPSLSTNCNLKLQSARTKSAREHKRLRAHHSLSSPIYPQVQFQSSPLWANRLGLACQSPVLPTSPTAYSRHSMLLVVLPRCDSRRTSTKSRRAVDVFKKFLGRQPSFPTLAALKSRSDITLKKFRFGFHPVPVTEDGDSDSELDTPTPTCRLPWDCAQTV
jgi:hypothetical protein